jgi:hypothetical protein
VPIAQIPVTQLIAKQLHNPVLGYALCWPILLIGLFPVLLMRWQSLWSRFPAANRRQVPIDKVAGYYTLKLVLTSAID